MPENYDMGLYDSDTGDTLRALKVVDITALHTEYPRVLLAYTQAKRGRIVQVRRLFSETDSLGASIHYFLDEPASVEKISEDEGRFGFKPGALITAVMVNSPEVA